MSSNIISSWYIKIYPIHVYTSIMETIKFSSKKKLSYLMLPKRYLMRKKQIKLAKGEKRIVIVGLVSIYTSETRG